jgi:hypothetical protein
LKTRIIFDECSLLILNLLVMQCVLYKGYITFPKLSLVPQILRPRFRVPDSVPGLKSGWTILRGRW